MARTRLNTQEKKFVKELVKVGNATEAALATTGSTTRHSAAVAANTMLNRPAVRNALDAELERIYPTHASDGATVLKQCAELAMTSDKMKDKIEFLKMLALLKGYQAPRQTENKSLKVNVKDLTKLPWEK